MKTESLLDSKINNKLIKEIKNEILGEKVIRKVMYEELDKVRNHTLENNGIKIDCK